MSWRALLLILFLYIALAWAVAATFFSENLVQFGLRSTIIGLAVALMAVIVQQILGVWRTHRAQAASKPPKPIQKPSVLTKEAAELDALRREAMARLASSPSVPSKGGSDFSGRSLFLVVGPANSGKTQTLMNSGLDPQLLAGQLRGDSGVVPTRLANFWLAQENIFVELSGHLYEADQERWIGLLKVLCGGSDQPLWKRLWKGEQRVSLRGILLIHDVQCAMAAPDGPPSGAQARIAQERLQAVADVFGVTVPVYAIFTKTDSVKFFGEFFGRLPQREASQCFGYTLAAHQSSSPAKLMPWAERETRRLTKAFGTIYRHLAERRLLHLIRESDPSRKPDIYEFPREFRRIRGVLVQLLTDTFKPDPLKPGAVLRGFYFTGTRMAEAAISDPTLHGDQTALGEAQLVRGPDYSDATHIFQPGEFKASGPAVPAPRGRAPVQRQWMFTRQLFLETIPKDLPPVAVVPSQSILHKYQQVITAAVVGVSLLMGVIWFQSWWRNRALIEKAQDAVAQVGEGSVTNSGSLAELRAIEGVRKVIEEIEEGKSFWMRWFLYTGDDIRENLERLYFRRLDVLLLNQLNRQLADRLGGLPPIPLEAAEFGPVYNELATHLAITTGGCRPRNTQVVSDTLKLQARHAGRITDSEHGRLADLQLDFYARALVGGYPPWFEADPVAKERARRYLGNLKDSKRIYQQIKILASQKLPGEVRLSQFTNDQAAKVFTGGTDSVPAIFTPEGWRTFKQEANNAPRVVPGDPCVLPNAEASTADRNGDAELIMKVQAQYLEEYKDTWKRFLAAKKYQSYENLNDALSKLELLTTNTSPVLGLIAFVSKYTNFPREQAQESSFDKFAEKGRSVVGLKSSNVAKFMDKIPAPSDPMDSPAQISKAFKPLHLVVAPDSQNWAADEKTGAYASALMALKYSLKEISRANGTPPADPAVYQQAQRTADQAMAAVNRIAMGYPSTGSEGLDSAATFLLEAPIKAAQPFIVQENPEKAQAAGLNRELARFCAITSPILKKYPFSPSARIDASLDEVGRLLSPGSGAFSNLLQSSLSELVKRQGSRWVEKTEGQKMRPSPELIQFLDKTQVLADVLYRTAHLGFQYKLRPLEGSIRGFSVTLEFDGTQANFAEGSSLRKAFTWPAPPGATSGATIAISAGGMSTDIGAGDGLWGVFRVFGDADKRDLKSRQVKWSDRALAGGTRRRITTPVQLEFVEPESDGAAVLLNPEFFNGLNCPSRAVQ